MCVSHFALLLFAPLSYSLNFALLSILLVLSLPHLFLSLPYNCVCSSAAFSSAAQIFQLYTITEVKDKSTGPKVMSLAHLKSHKHKTENVKEDIQV